MPPNLINEEYCPECDKKLDKISRHRKEEFVTERYYCAYCRDEYIYTLTIEDIIKQ